MKSTIETTTTQISIKDIVLSPFNYRNGKRPVNEKTLNELAESIKQFEVLQDILVRPLPNDKYELVFGERRYLASIMAGKETIPAKIRELADDKVREMQLTENIQREDPHPMAEAIGFKELLSLRDVRMTTQELSARFGKSLAYITQRMKLNDLIEGFREMYFENVLTHAQALKLSRLEAGGQQEFFDLHCKDWKKGKVNLSSFDWQIQQYQLDLKRAPFNVKDAKLDPTAGACSKCPNNTAFATTLFAEEAKEARCTNRPCFLNKCHLHAKLLVTAALLEHPDLPVAVKDETILTPYFENDDTLIHKRDLLIHEIDFTDYDAAPHYPNPQTFQHYHSEEYKQEELTKALINYEFQIGELEDEAQAGTYKKAILITEEEHGRLIYIWLKPRPKHGSGSSSNGEFKASDFQTAVKEKRVTKEILAKETRRLQERETRAKEIDQEKLQLAFYKALEESPAVKDATHTIGDNDYAIATFVLYDSLNWNGKDKFKAMLRADKKSNEDEDQSLLEFFFSADPKLLSWLTRLSILNKSEAKSPGNICGILLRAMVEATPGMDAAALVDAQNAITAERNKKLNDKIKKIGECVKQVRK